MQGGAVGGTGHARYIDTVIVEVPNPVHPYGARGVGETPIVPPIAAVFAGKHSREAGGDQVTNGHSFRTGASSRSDGRALRSADTGRKRA